MRFASIFALCAAFALSACQSIPDHTVARLDLSEDGVIRRAVAGRISNPEDVWWKPANELNGWVCRSPRDEQKLIEWAKRNCQGDSE